MSSLRSFRFFATHAGTCNVRPVMISNVNLSMRRSYTTAPGKAPADEGGSNPLLWIGCLSLGVAYTYYQKKQAEKLAIIEAAKEEEETVDNVEIKEEVPTTE